MTRLDRIKERWELAEYEYVSVGSRRYAQEDMRLLLAVAEAAKELVYLEREATVTVLDRFDQLCTALAALDAEDKA